MLNLTQILASFTGKDSVIPIPRPFLRWLGDYNQSALLTQIIYWTPRTKNVDGWFFKTYEDWNDELCLSKYQVSKAVKKLKKLGVIDTKIKKANGNPTLHYRLIQEKFEEVFVEFLTLQSAETSLTKVKKLNEPLTETTTKTTDREEKMKDETSFSRNDDAENFENENLEIQNKEKETVGNDIDITLPSSLFLDCDSDQKEVELESADTPFLPVSEKKKKKVKKEKSSELKNPFANDTESNRICTSLAKATYCARTEKDLAILPGKRIIALRAEARRLMDAGYKSEMREEFSKWFLANAPQAHFHKPGKRYQLTVIRENLPAFNEYKTGLDIKNKAPETVMTSYGNYPVIADHGGFWLCKHSEKYNLLKAKMGSSCRFIDASTGAEVSTALVLNN
ncbi:MAG: hypothetical protein ACR2MD_05415 [Aridibacter sp.]